MIEQLKAILEPAGLTLSPQQYAQMDAYHSLLLERNQRMDLTNVPEEEMAARHYADSLLPLLSAGWFPQGSSLIDVGTGAGFPGLPLAIARPDMTVCLLDALKKRCTFLEEVASNLGLSNITVVHARAEDAARGAHRERYNLAVARAVAPVRVLAEYLLPFVRTGGRALCWKGPSLEGEMREAKAALHLLGGKADTRFHLPLAGYEHVVQAITKSRPSPAGYPRKAGLPAKKPL